MLKKTITYVNPFTEQEVTEEHYFHISKADLIEMEMEEHGVTYLDKDGTELNGMQAKIQKIIDSEDGKAIMAEFKDMIRRSYGKREGERFLKSQEIWDEFASTEAFSHLLFELCTNAAAGEEFVNGVVPGNLAQIAAEVRAQAAKEAPDALTQVADEFVQSGLGSPSAPGGAIDEEVRAVVAPKDAIGDRQREIAAATPDNPVALTRAELVSMDEPTLKAGLADGRYKLS